MLIKLEINRKNIEKNLEKIKSINKNIICVLKDNAYGNKKYITDTYRK